ncbi:Exocyst complex subunit Exo70, C-terminal [Dillenia turbinata]|uniref:Exocyst subunit Exo70 family protein n=1 Tax=Dillenia turbinata TaxID=194707 RepID=A0AAN8YVF0_9MAGN
MEGFRSLDDLVAARNLLKADLEKSKTLSIAIDGTGPRLEAIKRRLPSLEATLKSIPSQKWVVFSLNGHIDHAIAPATAVFNVFNAICELEKSLSSDPCSDLTAYLSVIRQLEQALMFLTGNCSLAIKWLEELLLFLEENGISHDRCTSNVNKALNILRELKATEELAHQSTGLLGMAFDKLESEFRRLLTDAISLASVSSSTNEGQAFSASLSLPVSVIKKLQTIANRLSANNRLKNCMSIYIEVRSFIVRECFLALGLDYLSVSITEHDNVQIIEDHIDQWGKHLDFAVKHLFELEHKLCSLVFQDYGSEISMGCFAEIAIQSGLHTLLQFGFKVAEAKKDAVKLLKLLDVFKCLNRLRLEFNRIFGGKSCIETQNLIRDLVKRIVNGAYEIFSQLVFQVEMQRQNPPPLDGSVPRVVNFVIEYCNRLLSDEYGPILTQILVIHQSWNNEPSQECLLTYEVHNIVKALESNLETWSTVQEDITLSYFFMMNNHWNLYRSVKDTKLGNLLGESWLEGEEGYSEYCAKIFLRESWGKVSALLRPEGVDLFSGGRAAAHEHVKRMIKAFNDAFDDMYKKQSNWVIWDEGFRQKTAQLVTQAVLPAYKSFIESYGSLGAERGSLNKHFRYNEENLENSISTLYRPKLGPSRNTQHMPSYIGKSHQVGANRFCSTPIAT